jgi:hypothetical protein
MKLIQFFAGLVCLVLAGIFGWMAFTGISLRGSPYAIIIHVGVFGLTLDDWEVIATSALLALMFASIAVYVFFSGKSDD